MPLMKELADTKHVRVLQGNVSNTNTRTLELFKTSRQCKQFEIQKPLSIRLHLTAGWIASADEAALLSNQQIYLV